MSRSDQFGDMTLGERVTEYRRMRGLSQRMLAAAVRRSESWVSQVERNVLPVERVSVLQGLATALGVSVRDLRPDAVPGNTGARAAGKGTRPHDLDSVRLALTGHPALASLSDQAQAIAPAGLDNLRQDVDQAWTFAHALRYADVSRTLASLLPALETATRHATGQAQLELHVLRARAYQAAAAAFSQQDEPDAAWVAADRAISAAEQSGDPLEVVAGLFRMAHAFLRLQQLDQAEHVTVSAAETLQSQVEHPRCPPQVLSFYGAMHLVQAVINASEGQRDAARACLGVARRTADRLGEDRNDYGTEFGPTNVRLHAVSVAADLGDAGEALDIAQGVDASGLSPERRARFLLDVARAHTQRRHVGEATAALLDAERLAPEHIHAHPAARDAIRGLMQLAGRRVPAELQQLARRTAATP